jgi:hypothetical protein
MKFKHWIYLGIGALIAGGTALAEGLGADHAAVYVGLGLMFLSGVQKLFATAPKDTAVVEAVAAKVAASPGVATKISVLALHLGTLLGLMTLVAGSSCSAPASPTVATIERGGCVLLEDAAGVVAGASGEELVTLGCGLLEQATGVGIEAGASASPTSPAATVTLTRVRVTRSACVAAHICARRGDAGAAPATAPADAGVADARD